MYNAQVRIPLKYCALPTNCGLTSPTHLSYVTPLGREGGASGLPKRYVVLHGYKCVTKCEYGILSKMPILVRLQEPLITFKPFGITGYVIFI